MDTTPETMVTISESMVTIAESMVTIPETMVTIAGTMVTIPGTMVPASGTMDPRRETKVSPAASNDQMTIRYRNDAIARRFGALVRYLRQQHHWTVPELARRSGLSGTYVRNVEYGLNMPTLEVVVRLARCLDADPGDLVRDAATAETQNT